MVDVVFLAIVPYSYCCLGVSSTNSELDVYNLESPTISCKMRASEIWSCF